MTSFVYVGEYSDACVCGVRQQQGQSSQDEHTGADVAAVARVVTEVREAQQPCGRGGRAHH